MSEITQEQRERLASERPLHTLWSKAVGSEGYVKEEWIKLQLVLWAGRAALSAYDEQKREADLYKGLFMRASDAAAPILQAGGRYSHLLLLSDSIIEKGIPALAAALDEQKRLAEGRLKQTEAMERIITRVEAERDALLAEFEEREREIERLKAEIQRLTAVKHDGHLCAEGHWRQRCEEARRDRDRLDHEKATLKDEIDRLQKGMAAANRNCSMALSECTNLRDALDKARSNYHEAHAQWTKEHARTEAAEAKVAELERERERDFARAERDQLEHDRGGWIPDATCATCGGYGEDDEAHACKDCGGEGGVWMTWKQRFAAEQAAHEQTRRELHIWQECSARQDHELDDASRDLDRAEAREAKLREAIERVRAKWPHIEIARGRHFGDRGLIDPGPMTCLRCSIESALAEPRPALAPAAPEPVPERIIAAAVKRLATGSSHAECFGKFSASHLRDMATEQGFVTSTGRFVDRVEALGIALAADQLTGRVKHHPLHLLMSEDLWDGEPADEKGGGE